MAMIAENPSTLSSLSGSSNSGERENIVRGRSQIIKGEPSVNAAVHGPYSELVSEGSPAEISRTSNLCLFYFARLGVYPIFQ